MLTKDNRLGAEKDRLLAAMADPGAARAANHYRNRSYVASQSQQQDRDESAGVKAFRSRLPRNWPQACRGVAVGSPRDGRGLRVASLLRTVSLRSLGGRSPDRKQPPAASSQTPQCYEPVL